MEFNATFLVAAVSFIIFTLLMQAMFYHPVSKIMEKRKSLFDNNSAITEENIKNAAEIRENKDKEILSSKTDAKNLIMSEVEKANQEKTIKENELKQETLNKISEQKVALNTDKEVTANEMKNNLDDISNSILAKLTGGVN